MCTSNIIIIDDNGFNGELLSRCCKAKFPNWGVSWFRVTDGTPDPLVGLKGVTYKIIGSLADAAKAIKQTAGDANCDLIVFYDLQLGTLQKGTDDAKVSILTLALRDLMQEANRKMLVNVHSADLNSPLIAAVLDKSKRKVLYEDEVTRKKDLQGKSEHNTHVMEVVAKTWEKWEDLYPSLLLSSEVFLGMAEGMTHQQIQSYSDFIAERQDRERINEATAREKYPYPKDVLRRYLGMGTQEFEDNFCGEGGGLKAGVTEALKSISGILDLNTNEYEFRRLWWSGAWLLALGEFRRLAGKDKWKEVFKVEELEGAPKWPKVHAKQTPERRRKTLRLFVEMCRVMFRKKNTTTDECVLEKVSMTAKQGQPQKFSFVLSFPCINIGESQKESLLDRIMSEVDYALDILDKRKEEITVSQGHDTSRAIWRFFLSSCICDYKANVGLQSDGIFGGLTRVNIVSVDGGNKTEVVWRT